MMAPPAWILVWSARLYQALLLAYPAVFRRAYGPEMAQVFRDCCRAAYRRGGTAGLLGLWRHTLADVALSGLREQVEARQRPEATALLPRSLGAATEEDAMSQQHPVLRWGPYPLSVLFGLGVAYLNLHTDETPFVALPLLAAAGVLGLLQPRGAWRWALLTALWVPFTQALAYTAGMRLPYKDGGDIGPVALGVLLFSLVGAYAGVFGRWVLRRLEDESVGSPH